MQTPPDHPDVFARPPLVYLGAIAAVFILRHFLPLPLLAGAGTLWPCAVLAVLGVLLAIRGRKALQQANTNVDPMLPTLAITSDGPYRYSRNPLYVSLTLMYLGITLAGNTWWCMVVLVPLLGALHFGIVLREERYLQQKFGDQYLSYRQRVRRYV